MQQRLLDWFDSHRRLLPWREKRTPYSIWISEIMLQQTRVDTVIPYYQRWFASFPDIYALAAADEQEVLKSWEGLGYYSRARALHRTAKIIVAEYDGVFPRSEKELMRLPGIGRYTAGAIASIAFGDPVPALDGNIRRIYARLLDLESPLKSKESEKALWNIAAEKLIPDRPGDYHEALMDLGATICTPVNPSCDACPIRSYCLADQRGKTAERPVLLPKAKIPHFDVTAAVILKQDGLEAEDCSVLLAQRPSKGLLAGLWEFPGGKLEKEETLEQCLIREIQEELGVTVIIKAPFGSYRHAYTHFRVTLYAYLCEIENQSPQALAAQQIRWVRLDQLDEYPMGKIDRQIAANLRFKIIPADANEKDAGETTGT